MTQVEETEANESHPFESVSSMRAVHAKLVKQRRADGLTETLFAEAADFVARGAATGTLLDESNERQAAQSLLDFWDNVLAKSDLEITDPTLADFDIELAPELPDEARPYLGLSAFSEQSAPLFFGRQRFVTSLADYIQQNPMLALVGPSGSGKSSTILGGILPKLKAQVGETELQVTSIVPGTDPLHSLAAPLTPPDKLDLTIKTLKGDKTTLHQLLAEQPAENHLLVVDQFEETFTLCLDSDIRQAFLDNLRYLVEQNSPKYKLILTMRTDFESRVIAYDAFSSIFTEHTLRIMPLSAAELREAIEKPAAQVGLKFETGVVDALVQDIVGEPAALPLLQFTLLKLWENRVRNRVPWEAYKKLGGGRLALSRSADELYKELIPEEQQTAKRILLRMVRPTEGLEVTNNRIKKETLYQTGEATDRIDRVLKRLIDGNLVKLTERAEQDSVQVEVAHEALVRNWPRLIDWLEEERVSMRRRIRLTHAAEQWQATGEDDDRLWRGEQLEEVAGYEDLTKLESLFLTASKEVEEEEKNRERRQLEQLAEEADKRRAIEEQARKQAEADAQRLKRISRVVAGLAFLAGVLAIASLFFMVQANQSATLAEANKEKAELNAQEAEENEANAVAERERADFEANIAKLAGAEADSLASEFEQFSQTQTMLSLAPILLPQGRFPTITETERSLLMVGQAVSFNKQLSQQINPVFIRNQISDVLDYAQDHPSTPYLGHEKSVLSVSFSPGGQMLASGSHDQTIRLWDMTALVKDPLAQQTVLEGHEGSVRSVSFSPDGQMLASGSDDQTIRLWDMTDLSAQPTVLEGHEGSVRSVSFSPNGQTLASGSYDGTIRLWDMGQNKWAGAQPTVLEGHEGWVLSVSFSPDGQMLASGSHDGTIRLWDMGQNNLAGAQPTVLEGHEGSVRSVSFSPNGQTLASGSYDGTIRLWDMGQNNLSGAQPTVLEGHEGSVRSVSFSPDGQTLASGSNDTTIRLWDMGQNNLAGAQPTILEGHEGSVRSVSFSPNGQTLVSGSEDRTIQLWNLAGPYAQPTVIEGLDDWVLSVSFSPDSQTLASGNADGTIRLWDLSQPGSDPTVLEGHDNLVFSVSFSPDGQTLASGSSDTTIRLWDLADLSAQPTVLEGHDAWIWSVSFSPDGQTLASGSYDRTIRLWDMADLSAQPTVLEDHDDLVWSVSFSPNGQTLASGSEDRTIRLWDMADLSAQPTVLEDHNNVSLSVSFSPDGQTLASGSKAQTIRLWDMTDLSAPPTVLKGHNDMIFAVSFSPDGQTLASGSLDTTIRLWDMADLSAQPTILEGHEGSVRSVSFSPNGQTLASTSEDRTLWLWPTIKGLVTSACEHTSRNFTWDEWQQYLSTFPYEQTCPNLPVHPSVPTSERPTGDG
ncbi:MAG: WD40 repeat protein [Cellvibrionaceae bacterium]|jgi:WD40 repeat protein